MTTTTYNTDPLVDFSDPSVLGKILPPNASSFTIEPEPKDKFSHNHTDRETNPKVKTLNVVIPVTEFWALVIGSVVQQATPIPVVKQRTVTLSLEYWLYLRSDAPDDAKSQARKLFHEYDPASHGDDIAAWAKTKISAPLKEDMFYVETAVTVKMTGQVVDLNVEQRTAWLVLYGFEQGDEPTSHVGDLDITLADWASAKEVTYKFVGEEVMKENEPPSTHQVHEVDKGTAVDPDKVIKVVADQVVPSSCGKMVTKKLKIIQIRSWPEFKVEWRKKQIDIGCSTITVPWPHIWERKVNQVIYAYYSVPANVLVTVLQIAAACAQRAALSSSVLGVITANPALAALAFGSSFKACVKSEIVHCVHPDVMVIKEKGPWT